MLFQYERKFNIYIKLCLVIYVDGRYLGCLSIWLLLIPNSDYLKGIDFVFTNPKKGLC